MAMPEPPWKPAPRRRPARAPLTIEAIVDAAFRVLDREGANGLSMRRVAEELGTGPASLYWHVRAVNNGTYSAWSQPNGFNMGTVAPKQS